MCNRAKMFVKNQQEFKIKPRLIDSAKYTPQTLLKDFEYHDIVKAIN